MSKKRVNEWKGRIANISESVLRGIFPPSQPPRKEGFARLDRRFFKQDLIAAFRGGK